MELTDPARIQSIVQALSDEYSRKILLSSIAGAKSVEDLSRENDIPLSTCYRRVHELREGGVVLIERIIVTPDGKKYELIRSSYRAVAIDFQNGVMRVNVIVNEDVADKLRRMWIGMRQ